MTSIEAPPRTTPTQSAPRWPLLVSAALTVLLFGAWMWMGTLREQGYGYKFVSYPEAYLPLERPSLEGLHARGETLSIVLEGTAAREHRVSVPLAQAEHELQLDGLARSQRTFQTVRATSGPPVFASASLLRTTGARLPLRDHVADVDDYPAAHVSEVRRLLDDAALPQQGTTLERFAALWLWLNGKLSPHAGQPPSDFRTIAPFEQFTRAMSGQMGLFCANHAEILTLFATVAGYSVRIVDATGSLDGTPMSGHTFVELYVPALGRFVYTDVTLGTFSVRLGKEGPPLDSGQITQVLQMGGQDALWVEVVRGSALALVPLREGSSLLSVFLNPNATLVFHQLYRERFTRLNRALRYVLATEPAYSLVDDGARYRLRMRAQVGTLALAFVTLVLLVRSLRARSRSRSGHS